MAWLRRSGGFRQGGWLRRWFGRGRAGGGPAPAKKAARGPADLAHLTEFVSTRRGVEGFVEPRTTVTEMTLLLVAHDGEWTRRRIADRKVARTFSNRHRIPVYDAGLVGYPRRMREYNERRRRAGSDPGTAAH